MEPEGNARDREAEVAQALALFEEQGFAIVRGAVEESVLATLRDRVEDLMLGRVDPSPFFYQHDTSTGRYDDLRYAEGYVGPSLNYRKIEKLERDAVFGPWIENPLFERITTTVLGDEIALYRAIVMSKAARGPHGVGGTVLPWHQDAGALWGLDRTPRLQIWTALDDAPVEAGCLEVVPSSHRGGLATPLGGMIPLAVVEAQRAADRAVAVPVRAGDVVLLHNLVWHASGVNRTDQPRRGVSVCFLEAATRCTRKRRAARVFPRVFLRSS